MESESIWTVHISVTVDPKGSVVAANATPLKKLRPSAQHDVCIQWRLKAKSVELQFPRRFVAQFANKTN